MGYTQAFADAIVEAGDVDPRVVAITAAMAGPTGLIPFQARHPDRFLDVGIAEQHAVTAAAGMAMGGMRPVVAIYSTFLTRAFDQVNLDVGLHRLPVVFAVDRAGITGDDGPSHHGILDMALLTKVPGMTVFAPSSAQELEVMLNRGPVDRRRALGRALPQGRRPPGAARRGRLRASRPAWCAAGADVCILAVGKMVEAAEEAARLLAPPGRRGHGVGRPGGQAPRPGHDRRRRHAPPGGHRRGRRPGRRGGLGHRRRHRAAAAEASRPAPRVVVLGVPDDYIAQAPPAAHPRRPGPRRPRHRRIGPRRPGGGRGRPPDAD